MPREGRCITGWCQPHGWITAALFCTVASGASSPAHVEDVSALDEQCAESGSVLLNPRARTLNIRDPLSSLRTVEMPAVSARSGISDAFDAVPFILLLVVIVGLIAAAAFVLLWSKNPCREEPKGPSRIPGCPPAGGEPTSSLLPAKAPTATSSSSAWHSTSGEIALSSGADGGPNSSATVVSGMSCLCKELQVPQGDESVIALPSLIMTITDQVKLCTVLDKEGNTLLRVGLMSSPAGAAHTEYVLLANPDQQELSFCDLHFPRGPPQSGCSGAEGEIFRWSGEPYARIQMDPGPGDGPCAFSICSSSSGHRALHLAGDFHAHRVSAVSNRGQVVAEVTPGEDLEFDNVAGDYYQLRLGSSADSGLVIIGLLAADRILAAADSEVSHV